MATGSDNKRSKAISSAVEGTAAGATSPPRQGASYSDAAESSGASNVQSEAMNSGQAQTCCPNCQTIFEVAPELLTSSDTRVRCGECLSIFDAFSNLRSDNSVDEADDEFLVDEDGNILNADSSYARAMSGDSDDFTTTGAHAGDTGPNEANATASTDYANDESMLDLTYSDFDLFSGEAGLPEVAYFDDTQDASGLRFDETEVDETFSDTLFSRDLTAHTPESLERPGSGSTGETLAQASLDSDVDFVTDDGTRDPLVFKYRDEADEPETPTPPVIPVRGSDKVISTGVKATTLPTVPGWAIRSIMFFLLIAIAVGLYSYRSRDALIENPTLRPWVSKACAVLGCELPAQVDVSALKVVKRSVFSHPTIADSLVINLAFVNEAEFFQPYPALEIRLTDRTGGVVIQNDVKPEDYVANWQESKELAVGERVELNLTIADPGQTATSFEFQFR